MGGTDHEEAPAVEMAEDRVHLLPRLLRGTAGEILSRLSDDDPLRLFELGTRRARERFLLYDADRLYERLTARVGPGGSSCPGEGPGHRGRSPLELLRYVRRGGAILVTDLGEAAYRITTDHPECWPATVTATATATTAPLEIQVRRRGGLALQFRTLDGLPVQALPIELLSEEFATDVSAWIGEGSVTSRTGLVSDAKGEIRIERLPRGPYRCRWRSHEGKTLEERCEVLGGRLVTVPVVLP